MTHLQKTILQAVFLSVAIHIAVLNLFSFRIPLQRSSFQPSLNFLGSFLTPYDTKIIKKNPHQMTMIKQPVLTLPKQQAKNPHINTGSDRSLLSSSLPVTKKKTMPSRLNATVTPTDTKKVTTDEEPFPYTPLKLPDHDRY